MKRPSFQFYPADWRNDAALRMCSLASRGLWWEMICIMHGAEPYGQLVAAGQPITPEELARIVGESKADVTKWLSELERRKVYSVTEGQVIYSRRMVRDQEARDEWGKRQRKHRDKSVTDDEILDGVTHDVTPMSQLSSSSSSSSDLKFVGRSPASPDPPTDEKRETKRGHKNGHQALSSRLTAEWRLPDDWRDWALAAYPDLDPQRVVRMSLEFRDYWAAVPGQRGRKTDWLATWRNNVRKKMGDA